MPTLLFDGRRGGHCPADGAGDAEFIAFSNYAPATRLRDYIVIAKAVLREDWGTDRCLDPL